MDGDRANHAIENLALLCFDHHNEATVIASLRRKLTKSAILRYRQHHYAKIVRKRRRVDGILSRPIDELTDAAILNGSLTALALFELDQLENEFYSVGW